VSKIRTPRNIIAEVQELIKTAKYEEITSMLKIKLSVNRYDKESLFASSLLYQALGAYEQAIETIKLSEYYKVNPAVYWNEMGVCLKHLNRIEEAINAFEKGLAKSKDLNLYLNLGLILMDRREFKKAAEILEPSLERFKDNPEYNLMLASAIYYGYNDTTKIKNLIPVALKVSQDKLFTALYLGLCCADADKDLEACNKYVNQMIYFFSNKSETWVSAGHFTFMAGNPEKAIERFQKAISINPAIAGAHDNLIMCSQYTETVSNEDQLKVAQNYYTHCVKPFLEKYRINFDFSKFKYQNQNSMKLNIGFVSGDIKEHPIFFWISSLFKSLPKDKCNLFLYINKPKNLFAESLREYTSHLNYVEELSETELATKIFNDNIHILVDLSGHTALNRLATFALKPAPVQLTWLGQACPTGIPQIDYSISDHFLIKNDEELFYTEKIYKMPHSFAPYPAKDYLNLNINRNLAQLDGNIILGSLNNPIKINTNVLETWAQILIQAPQTKLFFKNLSTNSHNYNNKIISFFTSKGIQSSRIIIEPPSSKLEYLLSFNKIDIALDPFPAPGGTTSYETLMMSVPLITLAGKNPGHRSGESILKNAGLHELVTYNKQEYINKIVTLAQKPQKILEYKNSIREQYLNSPAADMQNFALDFLHALQYMWKEKITQMTQKSDG